MPIETQLFQLGDLRCVAENATLVHIFHSPFPGLGHMIPDVDGCRWQALQERIN